jgi:hypothetical protein
VQPLIDLRDAGWRLMPVLSHGVIARIDGMRLFADPDQPESDWVDTVVVNGESDAKALRANPDGDVVWYEEGTLADVVAGVLELPPPGAPGAPRLVRARFRLWRP